METTFHGVKFKARELNEGINLKAVLDKLMLMDEADVNQLFNSSEIAYVRDLDEEIPCSVTIAIRYA